MIKFNQNALINVQIQLIRSRVRMENYNALVAQRTAWNASIPFLANPVIPNLSCRTFRAQLAKPSVLKATITLKTQSFANGVGGDV